MTALLTSRDALTREDLVLIAAEYADLLAHARAAVAAAALGEADPIDYLRDALATTGQLPVPGERPVVLLARTALPRTCPGRRS